MTCCAGTPLVVTRPSVQWLDVQFDSDRDLTAGTVEVGFAAPGPTPPTVWTAATWTSVRNRAAYLLDSTTLTVGPHTVWARVVDAPEQAVVRAGAVVIR